MLLILKNAKKATKNMALYSMGSERRSQAIDIWYRVLISKIPRGVGEKAELIVMLLKYLEMVKWLRWEESILNLQHIERMEDMYDFNT